MYAVSFCNPNPFGLYIKVGLKGVGLGCPGHYPQSNNIHPLIPLVLVHILSKDHIQQCLYKIPHLFWSWYISFPKIIYNNIVRILTTINYKQNLSPITEGVLMHNTTQSSKNKGHAICFLGIVKTFLARIS